jgi:hypothetical protein
MTYIHIHPTEDGLSDFPIELGLLPGLKERIQLAATIEQETHRKKKKGFQRNWVLDMAEKMDLEVSDDMFSDIDSDDNLICMDNKKNQKQHGGRLGDKNSDGNLPEDRKVREAQNKLDVLLKRPLMQRGASMRYLTSSAIPDLPEVVLRNLATERGIFISLQFFAFKYCFFDFTSFGFFIVSYS